MGDCISFKCDRCGYDFNAFIGYGFGYPVMYCKTIEDVRSGAYGEHVKEFVETFPEGTLNCEQIIVRCIECGNYENVTDLTMYIPKEGYVRPPKIIKEDKQRERRPHQKPLKSKDEPFPTWEDVPNLKNYRVFEKYDHKCSKCGGTSIKVSDYKDHDLKEQLICPKCGKEIKCTFSGWWD